MTQHIITNSHIEDRFALEHKLEYVSYWSCLFNGLIFPFDTTIDVKRCSHGFATIDTIGLQAHAASMCRVEELPKTEAAFVSNMLVILKFICIQPLIATSLVVPTPYS